ncbi:MAG: G5 domain-containing protein [Candidatus Fimenecus sp.]
MITELKGYAKATRATFWKVAALIMAFAVLCAGTAFAAAPSPYVVDIYDGSEITRVETSKDDAYEIVKQADINLSDKDKLSLEAFTPGEDSVITIYRAASITFVDLNGVSTQTVLAGTVSDLLSELAVTVEEGQLVSVPTDTVLYDGLVVKLTNAYHICVTADGVTTALLIGEGTVADALQHANVALGENDEVQPALSDPLYDNLDITVYRVTYTERTVNEKIAFSKKTVKSASLYEGQSEVTQAGQNGEKTVTYRDKIVDGVYASSEILSETVLTEAIPQITTVGTKQKAVAVASLRNGGTPISELTQPASLKIENGAPTEYKQIITGKAAAYTAAPGSKTASGRTVKPGYVAVNPNQIPYGSELWIVSTDGIVYGYAIAADTGGFVNKGKFTVDLFMNTESECRQWGSRDVVIYVL